jgi:4-hydroxy-tetrahydrodipicolinate synthase
MSTNTLRQRLRTVQLVPLTAYDGDGELAPHLMKQLIARSREAGVRCFIPCAGSAEFDSLSLEEIAGGVAATREAAGDESVVLAPLGRQIRQALELGRRAHRAGADAVLVMPLDFPYLADAGARDYYLALADTLPCPVLIYKKAPIPSDALLLELAEHPNVAGVKYAVNDVDAFQRIVQEDGGRIEWTCGSAERFAPFFMLAGATGYTSGAGNICPRLTLAMHAAITAGNWPEAMRLQRLLRPIEDFRARAGSSYNISFLKHALALTGLDFGPARPPQRRLTDVEKREIESMLPAILEAEEELAGAAAAG